MKKSKFYKYHAYMIYTNKGMLLDKVLCDVIPCVCPLIDHGSRPMKALEFLTLLYKSAYLLFLWRLDIPIDMVAGTSIGAFVGAVYAIEADPDKTVAKCKEWSMVKILNELKLALG